MAEDHYQTLGLTPGAGADEVRAAYLRRMREHHPDLRPEHRVATRQAVSATVLRLAAAALVLGLVLLFTLSGS